MPTADTVQSNPGLQDATSAFTGLLDREDGTPAPTKDDAPTKAQDTDAEVADAETQSEETPPEADAEGEAEGEEAADTQDDAPEEPTKATPLYTVKINGKDEQVTLEEALKGYSRTRDYTHKTDALATDRNILSQEKSEVLKERQQYGTLLTALQQQLQNGLQQEPDWDALYTADPILWAKTRDDWRTKQDKLAAANFELQRLGDQREQEQRKALQGQLVEGRAKMLEMVPAWKDAKRWEADRVKIVEYGQTVGYTAEEIATAYDPRAVVILDKARRFDELMAKKPQPTTQRQGPQVARAGSAPVAVNQNTRAKQRLAQSGRIEDAAKVFMGLLE